MYQAKFRMSSEAMPLAQTLHEKVFEALSEPGTTIWFGDWWIVCTSKVYNELQFWPEHRPIWMTFGEWEQLRSSIKNYRLAFALDEKPLFMPDEEWNNIMEIKSRHGLLPDTNPKLSMDEIERRLDEEANGDLIRYIIDGVEYSVSQASFDRMVKQIQDDARYKAEHPLTLSEMIPSTGVMHQLPKGVYKNVNSKEIKLPDVPEIGGEEITITLTTGKGGLEPDSQR